MTNEERITVVQKLGYTERQAAFLCLAALHGGYFLRRQCNAFFGLEPGGTADRLINKAVEKGHVRVHPSANQTLIYHVGNKAFFETIGEEDNRNRRWRQPYSVKVKLMGFDFVLAHLEHRYFATESEKFDYFSGVLGINSKSFPTRVYHSKSGRVTTTRYFVDKFPLFLSGAPGAPSPVVSFCYIDGSIRKPSGFDTYVMQYRELWARLHSVEVIYVSADRRMFSKAQRIVSRLTLASGMGLGVPTDPDRRHLLEHFEMRNLFERRETGTLDRAQLDQLRDDLVEFRGSEYEALYQRWKSEGESTVLGCTGKDEGRCWSFRTFELSHDYELFGELVRAAPRRENRSGAGFISTEGGIR
jgi:hypothetical protein